MLLMIEKLGKLGCNEVDSKVLALYKYSSSCDKTGRWMKRDQLCCDFELRTLHYIFGC